MAAQQAKQKTDLATHYRQHLEPRWRKAPFVLRITEWKDYPIPVLAIKERRAMDDEGGAAPKGELPFATLRYGSLVERGHIVGEAQRRCLPILRNIVSRVCDEIGAPLELQRYLTQEGLRLRVNLPLDEEAGAKLALICKLQERVDDMDRVELIARRVERFTREEAAYWLSRMTTFSPDAIRWAVAGLRIMLGGQAKDPGVQRVLEKLKS
jgi:hypothetical protein